MRDVGDETNRSTRSEEYAYRIAAIAAALVLLLTWLTV
jgi:hypothetical protein